jgi:hypothetical protein
LHLQVRQVRRIDVAREMIFSRTNIVLKMVPGTIDKMIDERGPVQRIISMGAMSRHNENFAFDVRNKKWGCLHANEKSSPTRNLSDVGDPDKGHVR